MLDFGSVHNQVIVPVLNIGTQNLLLVLNTVPYNLSMTFSTVQTRLAGVTCTVKVSYGRSWYAVDLPCGMTVRINPRASWQGQQVMGNCSLVAFKAVEYAEGLKPTSKMGKMLRQWARTQCREGISWVKAN